MTFNLAKILEQKTGGDKKGPFSGILVVDFTQAIVGPFTTSLMQSLGATVVKVERIDRLDLMRKKSVTDGEAMGHAYTSLNYGKLSIAIDYKNLDDIAFLKALITHSDVLVQNSTPGVMDKLGFGYDEVRNMNNSIVYASISGFGKDFKGKKALNDVVMAATGFIDINSINGNANISPIPTADYVTGYLALADISAALYQKNKTGAGANLDITMFSAISRMLPFQTIEASLGITPQQFNGKDFGRFAPFGVFSTNKGTDSIIICVADDAQFKKLCDKLERKDLSGNDKFSSRKARVENQKELRYELEKILNGKNTNEWINILEGEVPVARIEKISEIIKTDYFREHIAATINGSEAIIPRNPVGKKNETCIEPAAEPGNHTELLKALLNGMSVKAETASVVAVNTREARTEKVFEALKSVMDLSARDLLKLGKMVASAIVNKVQEKIGWSK